MRLYAFFLKTKLLRKSDKKGGENACGGWVLLLPLQWNWGEASM